jgi:hypothetical protein
MNMPVTALQLPSEIVTKWQEIVDLLAEIIRVSISLWKTGKRRHAICKPGAWPREVHSLPAPSCIT